MEADASERGKASGRVGGGLHQAFPMVSCLQAAVVRRARWQYSKCSLHPFLKYRNLQQRPLLRLGSHMIPLHVFATREGPRSTGLRRAAAPLNPPLLNGSAPGILPVFSPPQRRLQGAEGLWSCEASRREVAALASERELPPPDGGSAAGEPTPQSSKTTRCMTAPSRVPSTSTAWRT